MSDENDTTGNGQNTETDNSGGDQQSTQQKTPEWYEKELTKVRNEAGSYRTKLREAEAKLVAAKTPEEFEKATKELRDANAALDRKLMIATVGKDLPAELQAVLKGDTEEELKAHAEVLKKFVPATEKVDDVNDKSKKTPRNLGGGLNGKQDKDDFDPVEIATKVRTGKL